MEDLVHGRAAGALAHHVLPTAGAATCRQGGGGGGVRRGTPERQNLISRATPLPTDSQQLLERSLVRRPEPCQDSGAKGHFLSRGDPMPSVFWSEWLSLKGLLVLHSGKLMRKNSNTSRERFTEF